MTRILAVAGAGSSNIKSTTATNLAAALASLGLGVELRDLDPAGHSTRALTGFTPPASRAAGHVRRVTLAGRDPVAVPARLLPDDGPGPAVGGADVAVVECAPRLDAGSVSALLGADVVLVPLDASPLALRVLDDVAALLAPAGRGPRLRAALSRLLPRSVDRWALVESIGERHGDALYGVTVPMGRATPAAPRDPALTPATLYSPAGNSAAAYRALARLVARDLGLAPAYTVARLTR